MVEKTQTLNFAHIPVFSRTFDKIPVYSRPGILIIKFQYIPGFPGCVRTLPILLHGDTEHKCIDVHSDTVYGFIHGEKRRRGRPRHHTVATSQNG